MVPDIVFLAPPWGGVGYQKDDYSIFIDVYPDVVEIL